MKLQKYYFLQGNENGTADSLVLDTETLNVARLVFFKSYITMADKIHNTSHLAHAIIPGYNIVLFFQGNLKTGTRLSVTPSTLRDLEQNIQGMADFFHRLKIEPKIKSYRAFQTDLNP